jgi:hypothetical protein
MPTHPALRATPGRQGDAKAALDQIQTAGGHLDSVVDRLLSGHCSKAGVGPFDQPLLCCLEQRGLVRWFWKPDRPNSRESKSFSYPETWQLGLNATNLVEITYAYGKTSQRRISAP